MNGTKKDQKWEGERREGMILELLQEMRDFNLSDTMLKMKLKE